MKTVRRNWTRNELILAFNLYCKTPFGRIHNRNPDIIRLANLIGRTPSSVSWKLANFSRLDPAIQNRGLSGATHGSKGEKDIWDEFNNDWEKLSFESELLLAELTQQLPDESSVELSITEGLERIVSTRVRVNQNFFRKTVLAAYNSQCCITGLKISTLLVASHIVPWSVDKKNRVNPRNGLCLNALHDRAFDRGLITVTPEYRIRVSSLLRDTSEPVTQAYLAKFHNSQIRLPDKFIPSRDFLEYHNRNIFKE